LSKKVETDDNFREGPSNTPLSEDLQELRQQLQSVKKQSLILMEQSRESSRKEKLALQQTQDAMTEKDAAVAEAAAATSRENSMLQLLIDASLDMAGKFHYLCLASSFPLLLAFLLSSDLFYEQ
jgi:hypothetical protein